MPSADTRQLILCDKLTFSSRRYQCVKLEKKARKNTYI